MVEGNQIDLIVSTIAVIIDPSTDFNLNLNQDQVATVLRRPITIGQGIDGQVSISSNCDQMEVHLLGNKVDVRESSGQIPGTQSKIPATLVKLIREGIVSTDDRLPADVTRRCTGTTLE